MLKISTMLEKAMAENRITLEDWEAILDFAAQEEEIVLNGECASLARLVALLEGGVVAVEGVSQAEVLQHLAVFI